MRIRKGIITTTSPTLMCGNKAIRNRTKNYEPYAPDRLIIILKYVLS